MGVFLGFFYSHGVLCCNSDHLDLVVYLMMRTQSARASQRISPLHHILLFVPIHHSSILSAFIIWAFPFMLTPSSFLFCSAAFLIEGFMLSPFSPVCFCQRDTCCRIVEFSCLSNLLTTLNYFIPALFHHIFTQPHCISIHSRRSRSFPSSWVSVSLPTQRMHSNSRTTESFTVQLFQYIQALSHFLPIDDNFIPPFPTVSSPFSKSLPSIDADRG